MAPLSIPRYRNGHGSTAARSGEQPNPAIPLPSWHNPDQQLKKSLRSVVRPGVADVRGGG
jgi:hypothetical protein